MWYRSARTPVSCNSLIPPIITSFEPGENWFYDYRTNEGFEGPGAGRRTITRWSSPFRGPLVACLPIGKSI